MALQDWNLDATWKSAYRFDVAYPRPGGTSGIYLNYNRTILAPLFQNRADRLVDVLGLTSTDRVAVIGGGYGWLVEAFAARVPGMSVLTMETSTLVQLRKGDDEEDVTKALVVDAGFSPFKGLGLSVVQKYGQAGPRTTSMLLDADTKTSAGRDAAGRPTWVITEDVLPCLDDAEAADLVAQCAGFTGAQVAHVATSLMTPTTDGHGKDYNWKTPSEWKTMVGSHPLIVPNDGYKEA